MDIVLQAKDENGKEWTIREIRDEVLITKLLLYLLLLLLLLLLLFLLLLFLIRKKFGGIKILIKITITKINISK